MRGVARLPAMAYAARAKGETTMRAGSGLGVSIMALMLCGHAHAHGGGLNAEGCHNDRRNGGYHCHRGGSRPPRNDVAPSSLVPSSRLSGRPGNAAYANCSEARAAGAAPVRRGDPGYAAHLDRDNDGIGCE